MSAHGATFRSLFDREFPYVWATLRRLGVHERDLKDVTQDVFLTVFQLLDDFDTARPVRPWLFGIAYRIALRYRALARHAREVLEDVAEPVDSAVAAEEALLSREARDLAHAAIQQIDLRRRAVFVLHEIDGRSIPDAAEALSIPLNTAYSRLRLAREDFGAAVRRIQRQRGEL